MSLQLTSITFDAKNPIGLARFWAAALRWDVDDTDHDVVELVSTDGTRLGLTFITNSDEKVGQNRVHLDLTTTSLQDQSDTVRELLAIGARHVDIGQGRDEPHVVLADPEGNEFCIIEPTNTFLSGCGRLGAVNCDGSKETGYFWSAALGWPLIWDHDEETAIRDPDGAGPMITWSGPPLLAKSTKNRLHLDMAPNVHDSQESEADRLISLGATRVDIGQGEVPWIVMADPDNNEFCLLTPRYPRGLT
jgi:catechol 2,3-dioxygenase-like lactoylglutathione lyase family enzyme